MATTVSFNGTNYSIPDNREPKGWGTNLSAFLVAVGQNALAKSGGTFTLTADANFGSNYGLVVKYIKSVSSNIAQSGVIRFANDEGLAWRNAANNADIGLKVNSSNQLEYNSNKVLDSTDILDEDNFASDSATKPPSQQSTKAYVDAGLALKQNASNAMTTDGAQTVTGIKTFNEEIILKEQSTPSNPSATYHAIYPKSDGKLYKLNSSGEEVEIGSGSGSGGVNYTTNGDFNVNTDGWSKVGSNGTLSHDTSTQIEGEGSLKFVSDGSAETIEGTIEAIDDIDIGILLGVEITIDVVDGSGSYAEGDFTAEIYDSTNASVKVGPVDLKVGRNRITTNNLGFVADDSTTYKWRIKDVSANSSDYFIADRARVTSDRMPVGAVINDGSLSDYDANYSLAGWGTSAVDNLRAVRHGNWLHIVGNIDTGTASFSSASITFSDITIDTTRLKQAITNYYPIPGTIQRWEDNGTFTSNWYIATLFSSNNQILLWPNNDWNTQHTPSAGFKYQFDIWVPVSGWSGVLNQLDTSITKANARLIAYGSSTSVTTSVTDIAWTNVDKGVLSSSIAHEILEDGDYEIHFNGDLDGLDAAQIQLNTGAGYNAISQNYHSEGLSCFAARTLSKGDLVKCVARRSSGSGTLSFPNFLVKRISEWSGIPGVGFGTTDEANDSDKYLLTRIRESVEGDLGTISNWASPGSKKYRWVRAGNKIDFWWFITSSGGSSSSSATSFGFDIPASVPQPINHLSNDFDGSFGILPASTSIDGSNYVKTFSGRSGTTYSLTASFSSASSIGYWGGHATWMVNP